MRLFILDLRKYFWVLLVSLFTFCTNPKIEVFVAPDGDDSNSGTLEQPFATMEKARDYVKDLNINGSTKEVVVYLRGGTYQLSETFVLNTEDSAPDGTAIIYSNYQKEKPVLSSGVNVTNWSLVKNELEGLPESAKGKVWVADIPEGIGRFLTMYEGNERLPRARTKGFLPDTDIHPLHNPDPNLDRHTLYYPEGAARNWENLDDVELLILPSFPWWMNILSFESVNEKERIAKTTLPGTDLLCNMRGFGQVKRSFESTAWIENVLEGLDTPGEWTVNTDTRKIYIWPKSDVPSDSIFVPALRELVLLEGKNDEFGNNDIPVNGITFKGITFTKADRGVWVDGDKGIQHDWEMMDKDNAMLRFRGTENCHVEDCEFYNAGGNAIRMDLYAQNNSVKNSHFHNLGQAAVLMLGYGPGTKDVNKNNTVYNNHIHNCGEIYWHSQMITMSQSGENNIAHNYIHDVPRKAICVTGVRAHWLDDEDRNNRECISSIRWNEIGNVQTFEELVPFLHARNNIIEYNKIHHTLEKLGDGSSINLSGSGKGNIVRFNYIYDCPSYSPSGAIRMDNDQLGTIIENNIMVNIGASGIVPKGANIIQNNFMINCCTKKDNGILRGLGDCVGLATIRQNIIYNPFPKKRFYTYVKYDRYTYDEFGKAVDYNLYFCPDKAQGEWEDLKSLKEKGADKHALFADPMFTDWENGDFTLKPESPAFKLGIKQVDVSKAGLTDEYKLN